MTALPSRGTLRLNADIRQAASAPIPRGLLNGAPKSNVKQSHELMREVFLDVRTQCNRSSKWIPRQRPPGYVKLHRRECHREKLRRNSIVSAKVVPMLFSAGVRIPG
jgi:hypothetical protein